MVTGDSDSHNDSGLQLVILHIASDVSWEVPTKCLKRRILLPFPSSEGQGHSVRCAWMRKRACVRQERVPWSACVAKEVCIFRVSRRCVVPTCSIEKRALRSGIADCWRSVRSRSMRKLAQCRYAWDGGY